ncbi:DUF3993 domain-containing protein [Peribacillus kribbensis]|uniref:DUF3993 domain-containing protein n=1 Tax=Peribacillus kribbensis TaxID=356658 RepID=UPI000418A680|nr:DUF3993 domain-containing protein [Peribacillus kribbensis]
MKKFFCSFLGALFIMAGSSGLASADTGLDKESANNLLIEAFAAQVSLSYEGQSLTAVKERLQPYFTEKFIDVFMKENIVKINGTYQTLGSDTAHYYIPFFDYDNHTKVIPKKDSTIVTQHFEAQNGGPVSYEAHDESVVLIKDKDVWKIDKITNSAIPEDEPAAADSTQKAATESEENHVNAEKKGNKPFFSWAEEAPRKSFEGTNLAMIDFSFLSEGYDTMQKLLLK